MRLGQSASEARERALDLLRLVGIPDPERRFRAYPHELSGGLRQRIVIAIALASSPQLLLCDEPTTALDVTIQDQILHLLARLRAEMGLSQVLVTHDLAVVAQTCERIAVMYAGRIVETGTVAEVFGAPRHPYTRALLRSVPDFDDRRTHLESIAGMPPDLISPPSGCRFHPRCEIAHPDCSSVDPPLEPIGERPRDRLPLPRRAGRPCLTIPSWRCAAWPCTSRSTPRSPAGCAARTSTCCAPSTASI